MDKKILKNILKMQLSEKQIERIKTGWNAFYNNPESYRNSVVVDMVKLSLEGK